MQALKLGLWKWKKWNDIVWYAISGYLLTSVLKYSCPVLTAEDFCWTVCNNKKYSRAKNTGLLHALTCGQWVGRSSFVLFVQGLFEENNYRMIIKNMDILFFMSWGRNTLKKEGFWAFSWIALNKVGTNLNIVYIFIWKILKY